MKSLSLEEVANRIKSSLYNNDYEYQRIHMVPRPSKKLAEGFDNVAYICPECESPNTIIAHRNEIHCTHCKTTGKMNEFGFIEGFKYDNLVDWDNFQKPLSYKLLDTEFESDAILYHADYEQKNKRRHRIGKIKFKYSKELFIISGVKEEVIPFDKIYNPIVTLRRILNFTYNDTNYIVKLEKHVMAFLRVIQEKY